MVALHARDGFPKVTISPGFRAASAGRCSSRNCRNRQLVMVPISVPATSMTIERSGRGFRVHFGSHSVYGRCVLLACGVQDHLPSLAGAEEAVLRSLLRICPICDAYEATGKRIAVLGSGAHGDREAQFLRTYSDRVTLIHVGAARRSGSRRNTAGGGSSAHCHQPHEAGNRE